MEAQNNKRRRYWILPEFQKRFLIHHMALVGGSVLLTAVTVFAFILWQEHLLRAQFYMVTDQVGQDPVVLHRWQIVLPSVIFAEAVLMFLTVLTGIFYSHRLAGPVYRIRKTVQAMLDGKKVDDIHLRDKDEFKDLADAINRLMHRRS